MRSARRALEVRAALFDAGASAACLWLAYFLRDRALPALAPDVFATGLYGPRRYAALLVLAPLLRAGAAAALGLSDPRRDSGGRRAAASALRLLGLEALVLGTLGFALHPLGFSRALIVLYLILSAPALALRRAWILALGRRGGMRRRVAVLGCGRSAAALARWLRRRNPAAVECVGLFGPPDADPRTREISRRAADLALDEVVLAAPASEWIRFASVLEACQEVGLAVRLDPRPLLGRAGAPRAETLLGLPTLVLSAERAGPRGLALKRALDLAGAVLVLGALAPLMAAVALAVLLVDRRPILFRQVRIGRNGRRFVLLKFRTMVVDAEARRAELLDRNEAGGPAFKLRADPRVTRLGGLLRRLSLDELPQLCNVLRGDMSFVGPRPPLPEEVEHYLPWQRRRLRMPPGLTGPAQVRGRSELPFEEWVKLDLEYVERWSLGLDARILLRTIPAVLSGRGAF